MGQMGQSDREELRKTEVEEERNKRGHTRRTNPSSSTIPFREVLPMLPCGLGLHPTLQAFLAPWAPTRALQGGWRMTAL